MDTTIQVDQACEEDEEGGEYKSASARAVEVLGANAAFRLGAVGYDMICVGSLSAGKNDDFC